jgi:transcriptional regulator GlxA family with amidase domain
MADGIDSCNYTIKTQLLSTLLIALGEKEIDSPDRLTTTATRLVRSLHERWLDRAVSAPKLAKEHGISLRQLHVCFAAIGSTYGKELIKARLSRAAMMLSDRGFSSQSISDIAYRCGFADASHLRRRFRENYQMTPSQYRERVVPRQPAEGVPRNTG